MSRDPLEGYRPDDTVGPHVAPVPPASFETFAAPGPISPRPPVGRSGAKTFALVFVGALVAIFVGAVAYFLSIPHQPFDSKTSPFRNAQPFENTQAAERPGLTGDVVVKQGPAPLDAPSPAPGAMPK